MHNVLSLFHLNDNKGLNEVIIPNTSQKLPEVRDVSVENVKNLINH